MKIKSSILVLIIFLFGSSQAQVNSQFIPQGNYALTYEKITSYTINSLLPYHVGAKISVMDNNGPLVEIFVSPFDLNVGTSRYDFRDKIEKIVYENRAFEEYYKAVGTLPPGNYELCLSIFCPTVPNCENSIIEGVIETCSDIEVIDPTPLLLANPTDEEKLNHVLPFFQWIPPMPISNRIPLQYRMKLVKLETDQRGEDAIYRNRPIFVSDLLDVPSHQYLSTYFPLEKGQKYAWMVDAYAKGRPLTHSEVWEFEIIDPVINKEAYLLKSNNDNGSLNWSESKIRLGFETHYPTNKNNLNTISAYQNNQLITTSAIDLAQIHLGKNIIDVDLNQMGFAESGSYTLMIGIGSEKFTININYIAQN